MKYLQRKTSPSDVEIQENQSSVLTAPSIFRSTWRKTFTGLIGRQGRFDARYPEKRLRFSWCQDQEWRFDKKRVYLYPIKLNPSCKKIWHLLNEMFNLQGSEDYSEWSCCVQTVKHANARSENAHSVARVTVAIPHNIWDIYSVFLYVYILVCLFFLFLLILLLGWRIFYWYMFLRRIRVSKNTEDKVHVYTGWTIW